MRKKRKGGEDPCLDLPKDVALKAEDETSKACNSRSLALTSHYSLEDFTRLKKRCKEDDTSTEPVVSHTSRLASIATAPPCGTSSLVAPGRGIKRKISYIDVATQMGRKNKIEEDYALGETLEHGKFRSVWLCQSQVSGSEYACKTLKKGDEIVHREVEIMQHLSSHPGVVTLQAVYEKSNCFHLVMELCSGGRLIDQMIQEVQYLKQRTANIFNPTYVAPKVLLGKYTKKVDIWSAGVLLHALLVGVLPFQGDSLGAVFEAIKNVKLDFHSRRLLSRTLTILY